MIFQIDSTITPRSALMISALYQACIVLGILVAVLALQPELGLSVLPDLLKNWDGRHYLRIAQYGYEKEGEWINLIVFFPFYPFLIRCLSFVSEPLVAGILITTVASIAGHTLWILYLQRIGFAPRTVWKITALYLLFPAAVFFTSVYTEGLFLLLSVAILYLLEMNRFGWSGLLAFCAALTRPVGIFLALPIIFRVLGERTRRGSIAKIFAIVAAPCGISVYFYLNYTLFGNPFFYAIRQREVWFKSIVNPVSRYITEGSSVIQSPLVWWEPYWIDQLVTLSWPIIVVLYLFVSRRDQFKLSAALVWWTVGQGLLLTSQSYWLSNTRYFMLVLPLFPMLERILRSFPGAFWLTLTLFLAYSAFAVSRFALGVWLF